MRGLTGPAGEALASVWDRLREHQRDFLAQISIAELAEPARAAEWVI